MRETARRELQLRRCPYQDHHPTAQLHAHNVIKKIMLMNKYTNAGLGVFFIVSTHFVGVYEC